MPARKLVIFLAVTLAAFAPVVLRAQPDGEPAGFISRLKETFDLDPRTSVFGYHHWKYESPQTNSEQLERAGCPQQIAPWARCENDRRYTGYYVGGGAATGGDGRSSHEGTFGWDYVPGWSLVKLRWFHGRRYQAGEGQYNPDTKNNPLNDLRTP